MCQFFALELGATPPTSIWCASSRSGARPTSTPVRAARPHADLGNHLLDAPDQPITSHNVGLAVLSDEVCQGQGDECRRARQWSWAYSPEDIDFMNVTDYTDGRGRGHRVEGQRHVRQGRRAAAAAANL